MNMNDDKHVDRYVRITNRERFLIVRAQSRHLGDGMYVRCVSGSCGRVL